MADTSAVASEVDAIVECIQEKDYQDAINIAEESAQIILEDEGFDLSKWVRKFAEVLVTLVIICPLIVAANIYHLYLNVKYWHHGNKR